jgi:hypothetical protein
VADPEGTPQPPGQPVPRSHPAPSEPPPPMQRRRPRWLWIVGAAVLLVVALGAVGSVANASAKHRSRTPATALAQSHSTQSTQMTYGTPLFFPGDSADDLPGDNSASDSAANHKSTNDKSTNHDSAEHCTTEHCTTDDGAASACRSDAAERLRQLVH